METEQAHSKFCLVTSALPPLLEGAWVHSSCHYFKKECGKVKKGKIEKTTDLGGGNGEIEQLERVLRRSCAMHSWKRVTDAARLISMCAFDFAAGRECVVPTKKNLSFLPRKARAVNMKGNQNIVVSYWCPNALWRNEGRNPVQDDLLQWSGSGICE